MRTAVAGFVACVVTGLVSGVLSSTGGETTGAEALTMAIVGLLSLVAFGIVLRADVRRYTP